MGDSVAPGTPTQPDQSALLRAQVNRFWGAGVPETYRFGSDSDKLPATGPIDLDLATRAVLIVQRRAAEAYAADPAGAADLLNKANQGFADPVGWLNKNLDMALRTMTIYGDVHGVPKATVPGEVLGVSTPILLWIVALGAFLLLRKG
jgi:hypothetical protein